jgi:Spy/CpxP family protein refolding chaperone
VKRLSLVLGLVISAILAYAVPPDMKIERLGLALITSQKVQKEIKLTPSQKSSITAEFKDYLAQAKNLLKDVKSEEEQKRKVKQIRTIQDGVSRRVLAMLQPSQTLRFRQIILQSNGIWSVLVPEITRTLKLTPSQVKKIGALEKGLQKSMMSLESKRQKQIGQIPQPKDPKDKAVVDAYKKKVVAEVKKFRAGDKRTLLAADKVAQAKALNVLSPSQQKSWKAMLGPKVSFIKKN